MRAFKKSPHYLVRNAHSYGVRVNVPKDLQRFIGRQELRYSLKTGYLGVARGKAQIISAQIHQVYTFLRQGGTKLAVLTDEEIQELVQQYLKQNIESLESQHFEGNSSLQTRSDFDSYAGTRCSVIKQRTPCTRAETGWRALLNAPACSVHLVYITTPDCPCHDK